MRSTTDPTFDQPLSPETIARLHAQRDAEDRIATRACAHLPSEVLLRGDLAKLVRALSALGALLGPSPAPWLPSAEREAAHQALSASLTWEDLPRPARIDPGRVRLCRQACRFAPLSEVEAGLVGDLLFAGRWAQQALERWEHLPELERQMLAQAIDALLQRCGR